MVVSSPLVRVHPKDGMEANLVYVMLVHVKYFVDRIRLKLNWNFTPFGCAALSQGGNFLPAFFVVLFLKMV